MYNVEIDTSAMMRRTVQTVCDIARRPLTGLRVLDLGCAHGHYAFEMAKLGALVLGIEGRETWVKQANRTRQEESRTNVEFVQDDVRNLGKEKYGEFDIVLCLGLLYHLDAPDVFNLVNNIFEVCRDFAVIETHFAAKPTGMQTWRGKQYWGASIQEHAAGASAKGKLKRAGASLDNEKSFWLTKSSLYNILQHVGFTSVYESRIPVGNLYIGPDSAFKIWGHRTMLVAIKGGPQSLRDSLEIPARLKADWPETPADYQFEQYLYEHQSPVIGKITGRVRRFLRRFVV